MGIALRVETPDYTPSLIDEFMLCRLASTQGATRTQLLRDLTPVASHCLAPSEIRRRLDTAIINHSGFGWVELRRARVVLTPMGKERVRAFLCIEALPEDWPSMRDMYLVAYALGWSGESAQRIKSLARPDGLRAAILQQAYKLPVKRTPSAAKLRCALAVVALERAFGNKLKSGLESGRSLSAKAGRLLAGQLVRRPREFASDAKLISALAAEVCGSPQTDMVALRTAILKNAVSRSLQPSKPVNRVVCRPPDASTAEISSADPPVKAEAAVDADMAIRPDMTGFSAAVRGIAERYGEGWPGNKKVFICRVWREIQASHQQWGLSEIEFKAMLVEAHRTGYLALANADLKPKSNAEELHASAVSYKNTVWHYVRAEI